MSAARDRLVTYAMLGAGVRSCSCDFDPAYHREFNEGRSGSSSPACFNPADPDTGLCTPCLFGCAP